MGVPEDSKVFPTGLPYGDARWDILYDTPWDIQ